MNRCDRCKHKDSCVCVPYGCECFELDLEEHDKQIRADAIDECMTILKAHHMCRTCEDDYAPKIERPFYQNLWNRFEQLKEQNSNKLDK